MDTTFVRRIVVAAAAVVAIGAAQNSDGLGNSLAAVLDEYEFAQIDITPEAALREISRRCGFGNTNQDECDQFAADKIREYNSNNLYDILPQLVTDVSANFPDFGTEEIRDTIRDAQGGDYNGDSLPDQLRGLINRTEDDVPFLEDLAESCAALGEEEDSCLDRAASILNANPDRPLDDVMIDFLEQRLTTDDRWTAFTFLTEPRVTGRLTELPEEFHRLTDRTDDDFDNLQAIVNACDAIDDGEFTTECYARVVRIFNANTDLDSDYMMDFIEDMVLENDNYAGFNLNREDDVDDDDDNDDDDDDNDGDSVDLPDIFDDLIDRDDNDNYEPLARLTLACQEFDQVDACFERVEGLINDNPSASIDDLLDFIIVKLGDDSENRFDGFDLDWDVDVGTYNGDNDNYNNNFGTDGIMSNLPRAFRNLHRDQSEYNVLRALADRCDDYGQQRASTCITRVAELIGRNNEHEMSDEFLAFIVDAVNNDDRFNDFSVNV